MCKWLDYEKKDDKSYTLQSDVICAFGIAVCPVWMRGCLTFLPCIIGGQYLHVLL